MFKCGFIGLIGLPNAGKSSLLNALVREKVSIVSAKPQTTRRRVMGLDQDENAQRIYVDSPGIVSKDASSLFQFFLSEAEDVAKESDVLVAVIGTDTESKQSVYKVLELVEAQKKPWILVATKKDIVKFQKRLLILEGLAAEKRVPFFAYDLTQGQNLDALKAAINERLPESQALFDTDSYTTESVKDLAAEIVREKCFQFLGHEIPFGIAVQVRSFQEDAKPVPKIHMDIWVSKSSHKKIVIGKGGEVLKKIGMNSRAEIEKLMGGQVFLDLHVVVKDGWSENKLWLKELGYVEKI